MTFFAKIAVELREAVAQRTARGSAWEPLRSRTVARREGWSAEDLICTCGPRDRVFEEQHSRFSVALVLAGTFQYRTPGKARTGYIMQPGSILLGNPAQAFECAHEHGRGDRCLSFQFEPEFFEGVAADTGIHAGHRQFGAMRVPATQEMSPLFARACAELAGAEEGERDRTRCMAWEEIAIQLAAMAVRLTSDRQGSETDPLPSAAARVTRAIRMIEEEEQSDLTLQELAREARLSPFHFLRTFEQVTGVTPHQYIRRMRLRAAATHLLTEPANVLGIAVDCGFGDLSAFNRAFRSEFGVSPRQFRRSAPRTWVESLTT